MTAQQSCARIRNTLTNRCRLKEFTVGSNYDHKYVLLIDKKTEEADFNKDDVIKSIKSFSYGKKHKEQIENSAKEFILFLEESCSNTFLNFLASYFHRVQKYSISQDMENALDEFVEELKDEEEYQKIEKETGYINEFRK